MGSRIEIVNTEQLAALLGEHRQGGGLHTVAKLAMSDADQITDAESETLASESRDARVLDQQLASKLGHQRLDGPTSSAGSLKGLGERAATAARD